MLINYKLLRHKQRICPEDLQVRKSQKIISRISLFFIFSTIFLHLGCSKLIDVQAPTTSINEGNVYSNDATAAAVLTGIYATLSGQDQNMYGLPSVSLYAGLSSDELTLYDLSNTTYFAYYTNALTNQISADFWGWTYPIIFKANAAIEGLQSSTTLTPAIRKQLLGEAKFIRAFCYFYLVNLYGDVCIVTSSKDWKANTIKNRAPQAEVWKQIIFDLKDAQSLLSDGYVNADAFTASDERVRPNKWAATALLARVYLYNQDWANAEVQSSLVINNLDLYKLDSLKDVFIKTSREAIWQLQPTGIGTYSNTGVGDMFILPPQGPNTSGYNPVLLSSTVVKSFEPDDKRKTQWINNVIIGSDTFNYAYKYKIGLEDVPTSEYIMILRLGELYLIRAESRVRQNDISGAQSDLDMIRLRAGLPMTSISTQASLLNSILHERQVELFTEWGNRWLDLKRTGNIDAVMTVVTPQKGGAWNSTWQWYPIPLSELKANPNLTQNSGY